MTREEAWRRAKGYLYDALSGEEADEIVKALEQEPFINKPCVSIGVCHEDKIKVLDKIRADIIDEKDFAYADFDRYKEEVLEAEPDELPDDDFRFGIERAIEIIDKYKAESEEA